MLLSLGGPFCTRLRLHSMSSTEECAECVSLQELRSVSTVYAVAALQRMLKRQWARLGAEQALGRDRRQKRPAQADAWAGPRMPATGLPVARS